MSYDGRGGKFDIVAVRGADMAFTVTATSSGSAVDLSAATIAGELYDAAGDVVTTMTDVVGGAGDNVITLSFTDVETAALTEASYPWTLWVTRGGDKRPWLAGRVRVVDSSNGVRATDGDAITLTVDDDVNVSISLATISNGVPLTTAAVAPATAPDTIGELYVNTVTGDLYIATGTASSADWTGILTA